MMVGAGVLLLGAATLAANAAETGLVFSANSKCYELRSPVLDNAENVTFEAWVKVNSACPDGARILDKWGSGSQEGCRLEVGPGGTLRFITTAPDAASSAVKLPADQFSQIVAVFSPRDTLADLYVNGKLAGSVPHASRGFDIPHTTIPLRIGADQNGANRFIGSISRVAVFSRELTAEEVAQRFRDQDQTAVAGLDGEWLLAANAGDRIKPVVGNLPLVVPLEITPVASEPTNAMTLWYQRPAREWVEALPVGNGRLGAMVFGGVQTERLQLNDDTIWSGGPYDPNNPAAFETYAKARELIFPARTRKPRNSSANPAWPFLWGRPRIKPSATWSLVSRASCRR